MNLQEYAVNIAACRFLSRLSRDQNDKDYRHLDEAEICNALSISNYHSSAIRCGRTKQFIEFLIKVSTGNMFTF